jgi:hypothetical protein
MITNKVAAATLLIAAGTAVAGSLGTAALANAAPVHIDPTHIAPADTAPANTGGLYVALAYSPEGGYFGYGNFAPTVQQANTAAMNMCESRGGADSNCQPVGWAYDACVALAANGTSYAPSIATTPATAEQGALNLTHGGQIVDIACSNG